MFVVDDVFAGVSVTWCRGGIHDVDLGPLIGCLAEFWCHRVSSSTLNRINWGIGCSAAGLAWSRGRMVRAEHCDRPAFCGGS